jgi:hypothetical protein
MNSDDYSRKQSAKDAEYEREYRTWIESLPAEERRKLDEAGLAEPMLNRHGNGAPDRDLADSALASEEAPSTPGNDTLDAIIADYPHLMQAIEDRARELAGGAHGAEILRRLALLFIDERRRALNADCLSFVSGLSVRMGESGTSLARRHGITRQAFHKRCSELMGELGLPPSRAMKSLDARASFRASNRRWASGRSVNGTSTTN